MKLQEALNIIKEKEKGFMVSFEVIEGGLLRSDHFPNKHSGEALILTEEAWLLAKRFAKATIGKIVNIYVIDKNFSPVSGYSDKMLNKLQDNGI